MSAPEDEINDINQLHIELQPLDELKVLQKYELEDLKVFELLPPIGIPDWPWIKQEPEATDEQDGLNGVAAQEKRFKSEPIFEQDGGDEERADDHESTIAEQETKGTIEQELNVNKENLAKALKETNPLPFTCSICNYTACRQFYFDKHLKLHMSENPFNCTFCDNKFFVKSALTAHMRIHTDEKPFSYATHSDKKPFKCSACDYKCSFRHSLDVHMDTHTSENRYKCLSCDFKCSTNANFKRHVLVVHKAEESFSCTTCEYKGESEADLKKHMETHRVQKKLSCASCDYTTDWKACMVSHQTIHGKHRLINTRTNRFSCKLCDFECPTKMALYRHVNRVHVVLRKFSFRDTIKKCGF